MQIDLKVKHQRILGVQQIPRLVIEKTTGFVYLNLEFDDEWDGCNIIVLLTNDRQSGNPVQYTWTGEPIEVAPELLVTGTLRVSCVGLETDDQGETVQRLTTKRMSEGIRIHRAGDQTGVEPGTTVPGLWEQAMSTMGPLQMLETENKGNMVDAINEIKKVAEIRPNVEIGEVETGEEGTEARVTNTGVYPDVKLNFTIPVGATGKTGTSPHIGKNGNWWLGAQDTGVVAEAPTVDVETDWAAMGNQLVPMYRLIITQPDGTKKAIAWTDGAEGQPGRNAGAYYPVLSEDGVLSFQYVGYMQPLPEEWVPTKIIGDKGEPGYTPVKGIDYFDGKDGYTPVKGVDYFDGKPGEPGEPGKGLDILGTYPTLDALSAAVTNPEQGDMYNVGSSAPYNVYMYDSKVGWSDQGNLQGAKGAVFTPFVDEDGNLSWSNDGGLSNPATVNIKGRDGEAPDVRLETHSMSMGNVFVTSHSLILTKPDGSEEVVSWTDGKDGQNGVSGGFYNPVLSADGVLSWDFIDPSSTNPTPVQPWVDTKIVGEDGKTPVKGVDYFTPDDIQEVAEQAAGMLNVPTGSWNDLTDKPSTFPPSTHNHSYNDLNDKPTLFSGSYNDLTNKPTIPSAYTHPTTSGNKHIPSGGSSGQILRWSADGTAAWGADNNTTYSEATTSAAGLMSASDKTKLNGIASGANAYAHPSTHAASMISAGTFAGQVVANSSGQAAANYVVRNSKLSASAETPTVNGQICWKYK